MSTKYDGSITQIAALNAYIALQRASSTLSKELSLHLAENSLTPGQFGVLEALLHLGKLSQRDLGQKILSSKGNITTIIDNLEKLHYVKRIPHTDDRRLTIIQLTKAGKDLVASIMPNHVDKITKKMAVLNLNEMNELKRLCKKIGMQSLEK